MGPFCFIGDDEAVTMAGFCDRMGEDSPRLPPHMVECRRQVEEYSAGERTSFDLPLRADGTEFQRAVWAEMCRIPHGETRSYGQVADAIGRPGAARAVGQACRSNPIGLIQPCHRVVGHDGDLVGFGGQTKDLSLKRRLIEFEDAGSAISIEDYAT
ncbi:MAG: methylated-DNA--[protein]-cysteine S-methyltransferase [Thermoplasmata archaeon]|nr:methylated-DNA--[protein]-cysteine S-methyltransferase [Thermoplasmata archaeon]NIS12655.1 methylated-DNA--[protein]-cysteine S-methyltransferase [Thermoplasmata archaeon]NIS20577.1 methylated-DNA--[protein]-cysteine S-methyltransferase [Thermoplasmata archaeon]NIT77957.1 methylated-DNA--[protein]-cysteine S-methyltransferase [Thermoplasmata archaeon]NIU51360.1 methylated-DNA--[protein]-cysteine S-methyltransferase [Thermoplasmata archaeon]